MGCVCCSLSSFFSILIDALERISLCTVCALLTCCFFFTVLTVLIMGIGIGYHYCFVQTSVDAVEKAARTASNVRSGDRPERSNMLRSVDKAMKRGFSRKLKRRDIDDSPLSNNNTINSLYPQNYNNSVVSPNDNNTSYSNNTDSLFTSAKLHNIINNTLYNTTDFTLS